MGYLGCLAFDKRSEAEAESDNKLAHILFETCAEVITQFLLSGMTWTERYPGRFVLLLDPDQERRAEAMKAIKKDFELLVKLHAASHDEFHLGADVLETMLSPGWPHPSPSGQKLLGVAWNAWRVADGNLELLSRGWLSLLATPGCALADGSKNPVGVVVGTTPWGLLLMPFSPHQTKSGGLLFHPKTAGKPELLVIQDIKKWRAVRSELGSPVQVAKWGGAARSSCGLAWKPGAGSSLGQYAAREGFRTMTKAFLHKLGQTLWTVKALILHFIPGATAEVIDKAMKSRGAGDKHRETAEQSVLIVGKNLAALQHCVDPDDHVVLAKAVEKAKSAKSCGSHSSPTPRTG